MEAIKAQIKKVQETSLITLYSKAQDSRAEDPILGDKFAGEAVRRIDYDFDKIKVTKGVLVSHPVRAKHLDGWAREFLAANPAATVLHLGCGLDSRVFRIDPPATVRWYDIDYPDIIELRKSLYPERHDYIMIGSSVTDLRWLDQIPANRPVLVLAEGLVMYLTEKDGIELFRRITEKFPGGEFIFDAYSRLLVRLVSLSPGAKASGAYLSWGISDPRELEKLVPRLKLVTDMPFLLMPEYIERLSPTRGQRMMYRILGRFKFARRMIQHLRYRF